MPAGVVSPISAPRERLLSAALGLFIHHGVNGTSLQMIADALGVTKAAVYHQFSTKSDLVLAVLAPAWEDMTRLAEAAEAQRSVVARREVAVSGLVDLVVKNRRLAAVLYADPVVAQLVHENPPMNALGRRIKILITGPGHDLDVLVGAAVLGGGLMMIGTDPEIAELDDETLRRYLLGAARRALHLRAPARRRA
jgi:AcrR family transcriptional regulator